MVVLQHKHSISLVDLNPKYPYDEKVYDDEEDLIIKQVFQCPCDLCDQKITFLHRFYYKCDQCDYSLHKLCAEIPTKLEHASHNAHTLTLLLNKSLELCHMCKNIPQYKQLCYHCSHCMLNICLECSMDGVQYHTIYHPAHQHPLIPASKERHILADCDACGKKHEGVFYECNTCYRVFIHNDCVFQPKRFLIQDGTSDRFFHSHQLILSYSFPEEHQKAKFYPTCRVCDNSFSTIRNFWVYKCEKCRYYVHVDCASLRYGHSGKNVTSIDYEDDPDVLHLPWTSDQIFNIFTNSLFGKTNEKSITHNSHEHPLILVDTRCSDITTSVIDLCYGCVNPITNKMSFYKCTSQGCNFVLHEWCTRLPTELKGYEGHSKHSLLLLTTKATYLSVSGIFRCDVCNLFCNGFAYKCRKCWFHVDVTCAFKPTKITHKSHPDHLLLSSMERKDKDYCRMCSFGFMNKDEISYSCASCNFHLHPKCALLLPDKVRSKYEKHPMTLSYLPIENHEGDYFCEECEEELNPNACFYHCYECAQSMHPACAPLVSQNKAYTFNELRLILGVRSKYDNIKFGGIHMFKHHPHPLSFLLVIKNEGDCYKSHKCYKCCEPHDIYDVVFKCLTCNIFIHIGCAEWLENHI